jgi:hypothetical protein
MFLQNVVDILNQEKYELLCLQYVNKWEPRGGSKSDPTNPSGSEAVGEVAQF